MYKASLMLRLLKLDLKPFPMIVKSSNLFDVCVNQKVEIFVLFVVLYDTLEESALHLSNVVRIAC